MQNALSGVADEPCLHPVHNIRVRTENRSELVDVAVDPIERVWLHVGEVVGLAVL